jgi:simple sugar transport system substrate-binding protein
VCDLTYNTVGGGKAVLNGPSFVDSTNVDRIATSAEKNTR